MSDLPEPPTIPTRGAEGFTITLFGDNGRIDHALSEELDRRGCRTHAVSVKTGWLSSAENVICRLDTEAGQRALEELAGHDQPRATVVAVCEKPTDQHAIDRLHNLCEECGRHHDVSLIWHSSVGDATSGIPPLVHLAVSVVDEVSALVGAGHQAFTERFVDLTESPWTD